MNKTKHQQHVFISVIMPCYNSQKYVAEAIQSILNQTFKNFELIIIDDGSRDNTWETIKKFTKDKRVIAIKNEKNLGLAKTLNKAISRSHGTYIARMDNDDWAYPDRLEKQYTFLESHKEVGIVGGTMEIMNEEGKVTGKRVYSLTDSQIRQKIFRYSPFSHPLIMIRRSVLDKAGLYNPDFELVNDYELYFRIGLVSKFANLPDTLIKYRVLSGMTRSKTKQMELETIKVRRKYKTAYKITPFDLLYNELHFLSIFFVPSTVKIWLFNQLRNTNI